jgi:hypothetical protein
MSGVSRVKYYKNAQIWHRTSCDYPPMEQSLFASNFPGAAYNFCLPHASLRQALLQPEPTHGTGSAKRWQPRTPAMAAGLTDHVWTLREVLLFRVPPWPQPAQV